MNNTLKQGRYRHYKGGIYEVIAVGIESDTEAPTVIYRSIDTGMYFVRAFNVFTENVMHEGQEVPRFAYIGDV